MRNLFIVVSALMVSAPSLADVVFDNPTNFVGGNCIYNTTCGPAVDQPNVFAAQLFTLASSTTITGGSVTNFLSPGLTQPSAVNWKFLSANGVGGLPGTTLFSGSDATVTGRTTLATGVFNFYDVGEASFALPSVSLGAGSYYFAVQAVSNDFNVFLSSGALPTGAAQSSDGGSTWAPGYAGMSSIAVSLSGGAVPEPASWLLMITGFGLVGTTMRRRSTLAAA